ncbi:MAG: tetratricopeptide repeat protein [Ignavibacteriaceae bacterium]|nr:tetratricopeptide repeat protein [Ignavibacteriaceae bacterium]
MYSEMLGNKYFLARNYESAAQNFQHILQSDPINKSIRKKLIICYTQTDQIQKAFENFYLLAKDDINFIMNTDIVADDCPCPELIAKYGNVLPYEYDSYDLKLMLAMLWLYCDAGKSLEFFKRITDENPDNSRIKEIVSLIEEKLKTTNQLTH